MTATAPEIPQWYSNLLEWLAPIQIHTRRLIFDFYPSKYVPEDVSISVIRGVWGNSLRSVSEELYQAVFEGLGGKTNRQPLYIVRDDMNVAGRSFRLGKTEMSVQWSTINVPDFINAALLRAWDLAGQNGLGKERLPFRVAQIETLSHELLDPDFTGAFRPCHIVFPIPLRLIQRGQLLTRPSVMDLVQAILNRLGFLRAIAVADEPFELQLPANPRALWPDFVDEILDFAKTVEVTDWQGLPNNFSRYSGRQKRVVRMKSISGMLGFPQGVSLLAPLFAAASTVHIGKGSVFGMGRPFLLSENDEA